MSEEPKRGRGRPPGSKNKVKKPRRISVRVEARKRQAKERKAAARPRIPRKPKVEEAQFEIVGPGEEFGHRPRPRPEAPVIDDPDNPPPNGQWSLVFPRPRGRPKGSGILKFDEPTLRIIWDIGLRQDSLHAVAIGLGVSITTLSRFFDEHPAARDVYDDARVAGQGSLKAELFKQALDGNTPALLFAAKHYLGMNDRPKDDSDPATKLREALNEFGAAISQKYLAFVDKEETS